MRLSIITTITNPEERFDPWKEALTCYCDLADEVVVVNGGKSVDFSDIPNNHKIVHIDYAWPEIWSWSELPLHLNKALEYATGDWVIRMDIDQFFHEKDLLTIRFALQKSDAPVATFQKYSICPNKRLIQKGEMILAINKGENGDTIKYGNDLLAKTDLCFPIRHDGRDYDDEDVPCGKLIYKSDAVRTGVTYWNFDYTFKPKEFVRKEFLRFSRAYKRYFNEGGWGSNEDEAFERFVVMMKGRTDQAQYKLDDLEIIPKYIRERYSKLTEDMFGYNGWGLI